MNCVDKADQLKSSYEISRKSKKWWHRLFWHFVTVVNSFIIYKQNNPSTKINLKEFRLNVVTELVGFSTSKKRGKKPKQHGPSHNKPKISDEIRFSQVHIPTRLEQIRNCVCCSSNNKRIRTKYMCTICKVPLCIKGKKNCYEIYHRV